MASVACLSDDGDTDEMASQLFESSTENDVLTLGYHALFLILGINIHRYFNLRDEKPNTEQLHDALVEANPDFVFPSELEIEALSQPSNPDYEAVLKKLKYFNEESFPNSKDVGYRGSSFQEAEKFDSALVPKFVGPFLNSEKQSHQAAMRKIMIEEHKKKVAREKSFREVEKQKNTVMPTKSVNLCKTAIPITAKSQGKRAVSTSMVTASKKKKGSKI